MEPTYKPRSERNPDHQYQHLLARIIDEGTRVMPPQDEPARMVFGHQLRFPFSNGFPIITERDLVSPGKKVPSQFSMAIGELTAFINGARTVEQMRAFGCGWWERWATPEKCAKRGLATGDLGPGSYGAAFHDFPTAERDANGRPVTFNQFQHLIEQIKEFPHLRTHFISPWIPQYVVRGTGKQQRVVVAPCHGWVHVVTFPERRELSLHHFQRSADVPVGLVFNFIQYAALALMLGHVTGLRPRELVYTLSDAHIYESQLLAVQELLAVKPNVFPQVTLARGITNLFDFRAEHFTVSEYEPCLSRRTIWTPV